jgi:hypothetical protein
MGKASLVVVVGLAVSVLSASFGPSLRSRGQHYGGVDSQLSAKSNLGPPESRDALLHGKHHWGWECCKPKDPCKHDDWRWGDHEEEVEEIERPPAPPKLELPKVEPPKAEPPKADIIEDDRSHDLKVFGLMEDEYKHDHCKHPCKCDKCQDDKFHCHWEFIKCKECQKECHRCDHKDDDRCDRERCDHCRHDKCKICKCIDHLNKDKVVVCKEEVKVQNVTVEVKNVTLPCTPIDSVENFSFSEYINLANWTSWASNEHRIHEILYTDTRFGYHLDNTYQHWKHFFSAAFHFDHKDSHPHEGIEASLSQYVSVCPHTDYKFSIEYFWHSHHGKFDGHDCEIKLTLGDEEGRTYRWGVLHHLYPDKWNHIESNFHRTREDETFSKIDIRVKCSARAYYETVESIFPHNKPISWVDTVKLIPIHRPEA